MAGLTMTQEDVIRMARDCGWVIHEDMPYMDVQAVQDALIDRLERFAHLVAAAEREACAKVCDDLPMYGPDDETANWYGLALVDCAAAIRARGDE